MIVFINGAFGVGKSQATVALANILANTIVLDPEELGSAIQQMLQPVDPVDDFQDYALWRYLVPQTAAFLERYYRRTILIPMTILRLEYYREIFDELRASCPHVYSFVLTASEDVLRSRILGRPDSEGPHEWCLGHMNEASTSLTNPVFGVQIGTDGMTPQNVAAAIAARLADIQGDSYAPQI